MICKYWIKRNEKKHTKKSENWSLPSHPFPKLPPDRRRRENELKNEIENFISTQLSATITASTTPGNNREEGQPNRSQVRILIKFQR